MYLVRDIFYCKPGKVRALVEKFSAMSRLSEKGGMPKMRLLTDISAERYWTLVSEMEVPSLQAYEQSLSEMQGSDEDMKEMQDIMKGYHELVESGRREIYRIEG